jgi:hypothetical protein
MATDGTPPEGCTFVLTYDPPEIVPDFPGGVWSMEAVSEWVIPDLPERDVFDYEAGPEADADVLCKWAAGELGYPVRLIGEDDVIGVMRGPFRRFSFDGSNKVTRAINLRLPVRWIHRRLYWVMPA